MEMSTEWMVLFAFLLGFWLRDTIRLIVTVISRRIDKLI